MKKHKLFMTALVAVAGVSLMAPQARAVALNYTDDDLFLGFYATSGEGATLDYLVNIGQASIYRDATTTFKLDGTGGSLVNIGNIGADLAATFGSDWSTRTDLYWGVFGSTYASAVGTDPAGTVYASKAETAFGTQHIAFNNQAEGLQIQTGSKIAAMGTSFAQNYTSAISPVGAIQATTNQASFASYQGSGGASSFTNLQGALGVVGPDTDLSALDLFRTIPSSGPNQKGTYEGTFTVDGTTGKVTFATAPVPEPSTVALALAAGGLFLLGATRRRRQLPNV